MAQDVIIYMMLIFSGFLAGYAADRLVHRSSKSKQTTWVYCPGCKQDLVSALNRIVRDTDLVRYYCGECNTVSVWDFDAPVPLLVDCFYRDPNGWEKP